MLDNYDVRIIKFLNNKECSTNKIAENLGFSWGTALKHLNKLQRCRFVLNNKKYWSLKFNNGR